MKIWLHSHRQLCLDEMMRHEGLGTSSGTPLCEDCGAASAVYRCLECAGSYLNCQDCLVRAHGRSPLHRIEVSFVFLQQHIANVCSAGQVLSSSVPLFATLVYSSNWAMADPDVQIRSRWTP
jgi:hypothetical protein